MAELGLAGELIDRGIPVREGRAFFDGRPLGTLSFESLPPPFPFVLSVPQHITESVLEERFDSLGNPVVRGVNVQGIQQAEQQIVVHGSEQEWVTDRVIACDGRHGSVRDMLGVSLQGKPYDAHYVMGDFPDTTSFGPDAAIYLGQDGLVESFPLPNDVRRWVARLEQPVEKDILAKLAEAVSSRTPYHLPVDDCLMTSSFTAERFEAERFYVGGGGRRPGGRRRPRHKPHRWTGHEPRLDGRRLVGCLDREWSCSSGSRELRSHQKNSIQEGSPALRAQHDHGAGRAGQPPATAPGASHTQPSAAWPFHPPVHHGQIVMTSPDRGALRWQTADFPTCPPLYFDLWTYDSFILIAYSHSPLPSAGGTIRTKSSIAVN